MSDKEKVSAILERYGLTAAQFADAIGIPRSSISHILSERNRLSLDIARKIVRQYPDITFEWLCNDSSEAAGLVNPPPARPETAEKPLRRPAGRRADFADLDVSCLLYTSPSPRD